MSEVEMPKIQVHKDGAVAIVTLNDDAWSEDMQRDLLSTIQRLMDDDEDVRAIVLTGADGRFCTGITGARTAAGARLVRAMWTGAKPVIAAVEGGCTGAGLSLVAACDMAYGARDSHYACTFVQHGLMPALGLIWTLPQKVGAGKARELMLRGIGFDAEEAARMGLLAAVCEPGQAAAVALRQAQQLAQLPPVTLMLLKGAMVNAMNSIHSAARHEIDLAPVVRGVTFSGRV
ncbi:MAG TPA: enoyl-CoA hydratase/isomerase family protein [Ramlibacter sp.]|nr:enoyl-CoA hydratase/isomerase family protein [Ramlibacter sp.]